MARQPRPLGDPLLARELVKAMEHEVGLGPRQALRLARDCVRTGLADNRQSALWVLASAIDRLGAAATRDLFERNGLVAACRSALEWRQLTASWTLAVPAPVLREQLDDFAQRQEAQARHLARCGHARIIGRAATHPSLVDRLLTHLYPWRPMVSVNQDGLLCDELLADASWARLIPPGYMARFDFLSPDEEDWLNRMRPRIFEAKLACIRVMADAMLAAGKDVAPRCAALIAEAMTGDEIDRLREIDEKYAEALRTDAWRFSGHGSPGGLRELEVALAFLDARRRTDGWERLHDLVQEAEAQAAGLRRGTTDLPDYLDAARHGRAIAMDRAVEVAADVGRAAGDALQAFHRSFRVVLRERQRRPVQVEVLVPQGLAARFSAESKPFLELFAQEFERLGHAPEWQFSAPVAAPRMERGREAGKQKPRWTVSFGGRSLVLRNTAGADLLATLIATPDTKMSPLKLVAEATLRTRAQERPDSDDEDAAAATTSEMDQVTVGLPVPPPELMSRPEDIEQLKRRLKEVREELAAPGLTDEKRERLEAEEDQVMAILLVLGSKPGKQRRDTPEGRRAANSVARALARVTAEIEAGHPLLFDHLRLHCDLEPPYAYRAPAGMSWEVRF